MVGSTPCSSFLNRNFQQPIVPALLGSRRNVAETRLQIIRNFVGVDIAPPPN